MLVEGGVEDCGLLDWTGGLSMGEEERLPFFCVTSILPCSFFPDILDGVGSDWMFSLMLHLGWSHVAVLSWT